MFDNFVEQDQIQYQSYSLVYRDSNGYGIFLGDASSANNPQFLRKQQIKLIVTAAVDMDHLKYQSNIKHVVYSLFDSKTENMTKYFRNFYDLIEEQIQKGNILVHCFAGLSRSATLVISYMMRKNKQGFKQTIAQVRKYRPNVLPNLGFERQLKQYQKVLKTQQMSQTRRFVSKTSQSRKHQHHQSKKLPQIGLPEIFALGRTIARSKNIDPPPELQPSSQMQYRKMRLGNYHDIKNVDDDLFNQKLIGSQPVSNRLHLKGFRKRSISITKKQKNLHESQPRPIQLVRLPLNKLAIKQIKFGTQKLIRGVALKDPFFR